MGVEPDKPPANGRCRRRKRCLLPIVVLIPFAPPDTKGRKRGEVVRTCTVLLQAHTHQFLGTLGAAGNGDYHGELRRAVQVITSYATQLELQTASFLVRLDGLYGDAAPLLNVLSADARSRAYTCWSWKSFGSDSCALQIR